MIPPCGMSPAPGWNRRHRGPHGGCTTPSLHPGAARETPFRQPTTSPQSPHNAPTVRPHVIHKFPTFSGVGPPCHHPRTSRRAGDADTLPRPSDTRPAARSPQPGAWSPIGRRPGVADCGRLTAGGTHPRGRRRRGPVTGEPVTGPRGVRENSRGCCSALAGLEPGVLAVDHVDLAATTDNLGARLVLQRPKGLADLHLALLRLSGRPRWPPTRLGFTVRHARPGGRIHNTQLVHSNGRAHKNSKRREPHCRIC